MKFFGPTKWGVPTIQRVKTPVGEPCLYCDEKISNDDLGAVMPYLGETVSREAAVHRECLIYATLGRTDDAKSAKGSSWRDIARAAAERVDGGNRPAVPVRAHNFVCEAPGLTKSEGRDATGWCSKHAETFPCEACERQEP